MIADKYNVYILHESGDGCCFVFLITVMDPLTAKGTNKVQPIKQELDFTLVTDKVAVNKLDTFHPCHAQPMSAATSL